MDLTEGPSVETPSAMDNVTAHATTGEQSISIQSSEQDDTFSPGILPSAVSPSQELACHNTLKESIPNAVDAHLVSFEIKSPRIFLDICSGVSSPLSCALQKWQCDTMSFDILINSAYDLLDDPTYERS